LLSGWAKSWRETIAEGLRPLIREMFGGDGQRISEEVIAAFTLRAAKLGVLV